MLDPVGPLSPRVYWTRRLAVLGVVVVVVALLLWVTLGRKSADVSPTASGTQTTTLAPMTGELAAASSASAASAASAASSASHTTTPSATTPVTTGATTTAPVTPTQSASVEPATPAADPEATSAAAAAESAASVQAQAAAESAAASAAAAAQASAAAESSAAAAAADAARPRDAQGRLICPDSSITLVATVGEPSYAIGTQPVLGVTVTNSGTEACVKDLSGGLQEFVALDAAGNRVWSTNDCFPGSGTDVRQLKPGESVQYNVKWSGSSSQPGCAGQRAQVPAGEYHIEVHIGGLVSSQATLTFT